MALKVSVTTVVAEVVVLAEVVVVVKSDQIELRGEEVEVSEGDEGEAYPRQSSAYKYSAIEIELVLCVDGKPYSRWCVPIAELPDASRTCQSVNRQSEGGSVKVGKKEGGQGKTAAAARKDRGAESPGDKGGRLGQVGRQREHIRRGRETRE